MNPDESDLDTWDPERYEQFRIQRERPVLDLLDLVEPMPGGRAADLGCGTGRYTRLLHDRVRARQTVGIDTSARMLAESGEHVTEGVRFVEGDLAVVAGIPGEWDVLFANASLQWLGSHHRLLPDLVGRLAPGGQLAFQVPANFDHPSHTVADDVGRSFGLEPLNRHIDAMSPASYAEVLWDSGLRDLDVSMRIYGFEMARTDEVVDWVSGSLLTRFVARLDEAAFSAFLEEYRARLLSALGDPDGSAPYFYAFPRILCRGRLP